MTADDVEEYEEEQEDLDLTGFICPKRGDREGLREILYGLRDWLLGHDKRADLSNGSLTDAPCASPCVTRLKFHTGS